MREEIEAVLFKTIVELQALNKQPIPEFDDDMCPLTDLPGFDSLVAAEALIMLSHELDFEFEPSVLISKPSERPATVKEIVDSLVSALEAAGITNG